MGFIILTWGQGTGVEDGDVDGTSVGTEAIRLLGAYPNPFNPRTTIAFELPGEQRVRLSVYDTTGREVAILADRVFPAGRASVVWDASTWPYALGSGVYFVRLTARDVSLSRKIVLLK
jgi:hypothetical protein